MLMTCQIGATLCRGLATPYQTFQGRGCLKLIQDFFVLGKGGSWQFLKLHAPRRKASCILLELEVPQATDCLQAAATVQNRLAAFNMQGVMQ